ncbi:Phosphoserine phosphatase RsbU [Sedimentisphaera cyanobacteriorum]|uniref:Phosphoserine phosphatase RsbU n=1 Tax=Sedimentisphaera cyanobacteriorum TaxID=1940790 RepID=A0A1Q2HSW6_9BACT|nr:GAF domain-containing SpoIIE family protein phosphatase [Sedimentisphaera cyanobacteriorum]AQQ10355.1 Phosphoserine phosphatase RsbU [Sedimentisphaera cyanobacteriorum]
MAKKLKKKEIHEEIYNITTLAAGAFSLQEVLDKLAKAAVEISGAKACSMRLLSSETMDLEMRSTYGLSEAYKNKGVVTKDDPVIKETFRGKAVVINDMQNDKRVQYPIASQKEGLVSQLTVSMEFRQRPVGVLRLYASRKHFFGENDISIARLVGSQCAVAITNARLYGTAIKMNQMQGQMDLAGIIQRRMMPKTLPAIEGLDIAASYRPCYSVGGDFYDFTLIDDKTLVFLMADVIGKGIPAAMIMSMFHGGFKALIECGRGCRRYSIFNFADVLNNFACKHCNKGEFITTFIGVFEFRKGLLHYTNCGHEPGLLLRNSEIIELDKGGPVLGLDIKSQFESGTIDLKENDIYMFYTDGLVDAVNFDGHFWGKNNLYQTAKRCTHKMDAETITKTVLNYRRRFTGLSQQQDDTSLVTFKVNKLNTETAQPEYNI